jgi:Fe2+ or Zn2+ uptake regulation protein
MAKSKSSLKIISEEPNRSVHKRSARELQGQLKESGNRMTKARQALLEIFTGNHSPMSAHQLGQQLRERGIDVNKTTIYREIDFLIEQKIVREIDLLDGKKRYEIFNEDSHHHHLVCTKCNLIQCVELPRDLEMLEKKISREYGFKIDGHILEFFGRCGDCQ